MTDIVEEILPRLARAGWSIDRIVAPALIVEGRDLGVSIVHAHRGELRGWLVVLRECEDGDMADRFAFLAGPSPAIASRRLAGAKVRAKVADGERAREELARLRPVLSSLSTLTPERTAAVLGDAGWQIDERDETVLDEPSWRVRASRPGELLELHVGLGRGGPPALDVGDDGAAHLVTEHASAFASVASVDEARRLVEIATALR